MSFYVHDVILMIYSRYLSYHMNSYIEKRNISHVTIINVLNRGMVRRYNTCLVNVMFSLHVKCLFCRFRKRICAFYTPQIATSSQLYKFAQWQWSLLRLPHPPSLFPAMNMHELFVAAKLSHICSIWKGPGGSMS